MIVRLSFNYEYTYVWKTKYKIDQPAGRVFKHLTDMQKCQVQQFYICTCCLVNELENISVDLHVHTYLQKWWLRCVWAHDKLLSRLFTTWRAMHATISRYCTHSVAANKNNNRQPKFEIVSFNEQLHRFCPSSSGEPYRDCTICA